MFDTNNTANFAAIISKSLTENDMSFTSKIRGDDTLFELPMSAKNAPGIDVKLIVGNDGDCRLRTFLIHDIPQSKWPAMLKIINDLNVRFRYVCISLDRDGDICVSYDFPLIQESEDLFDRIMAMVFMFSEIADKCIPNILRTLWAPDDEDPVPKNIKSKLFEEEGEDE